MTRLEQAECVVAQPWFLLAFNGALVALWLLFGVEASNWFISIVTAELVLLSAGANRRAALATQAKLDELIHATEGARDDLTHLEERAEQEITEARR